MSLPLGQPVTLSFLTYSDAAQTIPADATTVSVDILDPAGATSTYTLGAVVHAGTGNYTFTYTPAIPGHYAFYWKATGAVATALPGAFDVEAKYGGIPTAFATPEQLASSLGVATPADAVTLGVWADALDDASNYLRTVIGQPITASTATLSLLTDSRGESDIFLVPVTAVTTVTDPEGNVVTSDDYTLKDQRLYLRRAYTTYAVTVAYGYTTIPPELVRWTKILAAAQIQVAPTGSLGIDNITSVAIDDGKVTYAGGSAVELPAATAQWLKATFGGPQ